MAEDNLSLTAELLLLAINPADGGLFPRDRGRFRKALRETYRSDRGERRSAWRARRHALLELELAGIVEPPRGLGRRLRLADRGRAADRFHRLQRCLDQDDFPEPRDRELAILLAWSGVLARRLSRGQRRIAVRRLRKLARSLERDGLWQGAPLSGTVAALAVGRVAHDDFQSDLLHGALSDFATGGESCFNAVGLSGAGGDSCSGSDGGGGPTP